MEAAVASGSDVDPDTGRPTDTPLLATNQKKNDEHSLAAPLVVPVAPASHRVTEAVLTLIHPALDVKSWTEIEPDVEAARPSHCPRCGGAAHRDDGLRLHGHGLRERCIWGPPEVGAESMRGTILLRRYRCIECRAVCTVAPRGIATRFLYATTAIASALLMWGVWLWTAAKCRLEVSPDRIRGVSEPERWRSLQRWARRSSDLFGLPEVNSGASVRGRARRAGHILVGRGPPDLDQHRRAVEGALAR